jgi:hypothetical protein
MSDFRVAIHETNSESTVGGVGRVQTNWFATDHFAEIG